VVNTDAIFMRVIKALIETNRLIAVRRVKTKKSRNDLTAVTACLATFFPFCERWHNM
jgi:hypothetical protein